MSAPSEVVSTRTINRVWSGLLVVASLALCGCPFYGDKQRTWTEDVLLDDGSRLTIKRHVEFTDHNSLARDSYGAYETKATLQFVGEFSTVPVWDVPLIPLVLYRDVDARQWVLVVTTGMCETWQHGSPIPPYWEFRSDGGSWRATDLSPHSIGKNSNLFFRFHSGVPSRHLMVDQKAKLLAASNTAPKGSASVEFASDRVLLQRRAAQSKSVKSGQAGKQVWPHKSNSQHSPSTLIARLT